MLVGNGILEAPRLVAPRAHVHADVALACDRMGGSPFAIPCILGPHAHSEQLEGCGCGSCGSECCSMLSRRRRDQACPAARDIASLERADPMSGRSATAEIRPGCKHGPALAVAIGAGVTPGLSRQVTCERRIEARAHHAVGRDRRWLCIGRSHPRSSDRPIEDDCVSSRSRGKRRAAAVLLTLHLSSTEATDDTST